MTEVSEEQIGFNWIGRVCFLDYSECGQLNMQNINEILLDPIKIIIIESINFMKWFKN